MCPQDTHYGVLVLALIELRLFHKGQSQAGSKGLYHRVGVQWVRGSVDPKVRAGGPGWGSEVRWVRAGGLEVGAQTKHL